MAFQIVSQGYTDGPTAPTVEEARKKLIEIARDELAACKRRYGNATLVKRSPDSYEVLIGNRQSVSRWSSHAIVSA